MMKGTRGFVIAVVGATLVTWAGSTGLAQQREVEPPRQGAGERLGERLDNALREASDTLRDRFAKARTSVNNMGVEARIYGRLHWDKKLQDSTIELEVREDGVTTLRGAVADAAAKSRAVDLARETVGVSQVVDQLTIGLPEKGEAGTTTRTIEKKTTIETRP